jgi:sugar lactone lactonase YvrE
MKQVLGLENVRIFYDGTASEPRLNHPECVAVDSDGSIWCGGEEGELYHLAADGSSVRLAAKSGGFTLGIAVDAPYVYMCDMLHACVYRFDLRTNELERWADGDGDRKIGCPNYPLVDHKRGVLYVSDSQENGPGVWRFQLDTGEGELWMSEDCVFANGLALSPDGDSLYIVESFAGRISKVGIAPDGSAIAKQSVVDVPDTVPDGLAFDQQGRLYISCYEPSSLYRYDPADGLELLIHDKRCEKLVHPTNIAFRGEQELFAANLGAWHISVLDLETEGDGTP